MMEERLQKILDITGQLSKAMTSMAHDLISQAEKIEAQAKRIERLEGRHHDNR